MILPITYCEGCGKRTIDLFGGLCIDCHEKLPGGSPDNASSP